MRRTHRIAAVLLASVVGLASPALAATVTRAPASTPAATLDTALTNQLAAAAGDLTVIVHGTGFDAVASAIDGTGMTRVYDMPLIDAAIAVGTPDQIQTLATRAGITHLEGDQPLEYLDDTSNLATRGAQLVDGYDVTVETDDVHVQADGAGVSIAIIDSGVDGTHPAFAVLDENGEPTAESRVVVNKKFAPLVDGAAVDVPGNDSDTISAGGHGTHVAGIAAGGPFTTDDGRVITGAAPGAKVVALSAGAALSVAAATEAQYWVLENHADPCGDLVRCPPIRVVNNSYGPSGGGEFDAGSATVEIQRQLAREGVVMVWAAGNDGGGGTDNRSNPPGQDPTPGVLMVANYDDHDTGTRDGSLAPSSSRGDANRQRTWPDISAPGTDITSACRPTLAICSSGEGDAGTISGTSMATPHVVGIVAQLFELVPDATPAHIEDTIEDTAHQFDFGAGYYPDFRNADHTTSFDKGHGLIDAEAAANDLLGLVEADPVTGTPSCSTDDPLIADPAGDGFVSDAFLVNVDPGITPRQEPTSDDTVDLRSIRAVPTSDGVDVVFTLTDVTGEPPEGKDGSRMHLQATMGDNTYYVATTISGDPVGETTTDFGIDVLDQNVYNEIINLEGDLDTDAETITIHVTNSAIDAYNQDPTRARPEIPRLEDGTRWTGLAALTQTSTSAVAVSSLADADSAAGQCAFEYPAGAVDAGGPQESVDQNDSGVDQNGDPVEGSGTGPTVNPDTAGEVTLASGESDSVDGTVSTTNLEYSCTDVADETCITHLVHVTDAGTLTLGVEARTPAEDLDLVVYDGAGNQLQVFGNPGTPPGGLEGGTLDVEPGAYFVQIQPYTTEGSDDGLTGGTTYTLDLALS